MSASPLDQSQQQQPPPVAVTQQADTGHSRHGSVGPVIAVLAVITILGVIAGLIGRLCSGRRVMGYGQYDCEGWLERKCSSCINGHVDSNPTRKGSRGSGHEVHVAVPAEGREASREIKEEEGEEEEEEEEREGGERKQSEAKPHVGSSGS